VASYRLGEEGLNTNRWHGLFSYCYTHTDCRAHSALPPRINGRGFILWG